MSSKTIWELVKDYTVEHTVNFEIVRSLKLGEILLQGVAEIVQVDSPQKTKRYLGYLFLSAATRAVSRYRHEHLMNMDKKTGIMHLMAYAYCLVQPVLEKATSKYELVMKEISDPSTTIFGEDLVEFLIKFDPEVDLKIIKNMEKIKDYLPGLYAKMDIALVLSYAILDILAQNQESDEFLTKLIFKYYRIIPDLVAFNFYGPDTLLFVYETLEELSKASGAIN